MYILGVRIKSRQRRLIERALILIGTTVLISSGSAYALTQFSDIENELPFMGVLSHQKDAVESNRNGNIMGSNSGEVDAAQQFSGANIASKNIIDNFQNVSCARESTITNGLRQSILPQLQKLYEYETVCGGKATDTLMHFARMPADVTDAELLAQDMVIALREFKKYGIRPLVIWEPTTSKGLIGFKQFHAGAYDEALEHYFSFLKTQGISDADMGIWVPFPEANIPEWDDTNPDDVAANITKSAQMQKKYFPGSKVSVVLDSLSYPPGQRSWDGGAYVSLAPYVKDIPKGLIDSFGYQGFPWAPPANQPSPANYRADRFLQAALAIEAAHILGVTDVWLNTGTFSRMHAESATSTNTISNALRREILNGILVEAEKIKVAGLGVSVALFAEDKSGVAEAADWSYWPGGNMDANPEGVAMFRAFSAALIANNMDLWLFDTAK